MRGAAVILGVARVLYRGVVGAFFGVAVGLLVAIAGPIAIGWRPFTVMSGSMEPAIDTGAVVVTEPIAPLEARVGDVVTFADPHQPGRLISHRVRLIRARGDKASFVTKGDANNVQERWSVRTDGRIGRVVYHVPRVGYLAVAAARPSGRLALVAIPALLLAVFELVKIWRPARREPTGVAEPLESSNG